MATGETIHCECGTITGVRCAWEGSEADTVTVEWMPEDIRASHEAAGNSGYYPNNGARRLTVERSCAESLVDDWTSIVEARS